MESISEYQLWGVGQRGCTPYYELETKTKVLGECVTVELASSVYTIVSLRKPVTNGKKLPVIILLGTRTLAPYIKSVTV